jgi:dTDP-4-dehydrorhamnose reductase
MIRVLVLGASGMLGSMVVRWLGRNPKLTVACSLRRPPQPFSPGHRGNVFALDLQNNPAPEITAILDHFDADYIVNCIGVINVDCRDNNAAGVLQAVRVNALFPHLLADTLAASGRNVRVAHITTDCVFSGSAGGYDERSIADPVDFYGKSKLLGEVQQQRWLNIRCSVIGPDPVRKRSFLEWVLSHPLGATVPGFQHHRWSGVTSLQYAQFCEELIVENRYSELRDFGPTVHFVPNRAVTKYELVRCVSSVFERGLNVVPAAEPPPAIDRTLRSLYLPAAHYSIESALGELREFWAAEQGQIGQSIKQG